MVEGWISAETARQETGCVLDESVDRSPAGAVRLEDLHGEKNTAAEFHLHTYTPNAILQHCLGGGGEEKK